MSTRTGARPDGAEKERTKAKLLRLPAALILVNGALLAPTWVLARRIGPPWLSLEAVFLVGAFALLPARRWVRWPAAVAGVTVLVSLLVGVGDTTLRLSLGRPANLYVDLWLLDSVWDLLIGTFGPVLAVLAVLAALLGAAAVVAGVGWLVAGLAGSAWLGRGPLRWAGAVTIVLVVATLVAAERVPLLAPAVDAPVARLANEQAVRFAAMLGERDRFAEALAVYPGSYGDLPGLLDRLDGRDVVFAFVESYGVTALYDPRYAPVVGPRLDDLERRMAAAGLHIMSGRMVAPSQGGQSWFCHGSLLSGLWLDNQLRYDMMLSTGRETLIDDFERAGHRTVALMPAITAAWPEGQRFGYDRVYTRDRIEYRGPPLNWVTMPDQFTWSFLERIREGTVDGNAEGRSPEPPIFAELALISSHAPWTPILPVLDDWSSIGDGSVFEPWRNAGERPEDLWLDTEKVRQHYALSIEYALHAMTGYAERYVDDHTLLMVLGDHQPAPLVTGEEAPWEVPVHVISGDPELLEPFRAWGFIEGAWPEPTREALGVDHFRDWFVHAYSGP